MSYIDELNAFDRWCENDFLPALSQLMWYKLMALRNRLGWPEWVRVSNLRFMAMVCVDSENTFIRARDKLIEKGLVLYKKGKKGAPNEYGMVFLTKHCKIYSQNDSICGSVSSSESGSENDSQSGGQYKTKTEIKTKTKTPPLPPVGRGAAVPDFLKESWEAFAEMRRAMKKPLTGKAVDLALRELEKLAPGDGTAQRAIVEQSVVKGWSGFYRLDGGGGYGQKQKGPLFPDYSDPARYANEVSEVEKLLRK